MRKYFNILTVILLSFFLFGCGKAVEAPEKIPESEIKQTEITSETEEEIKEEIKKEIKEEKTAPIVTEPQNHEIKTTKEPQQEEVQVPEELTCTLSVRCDTILNNMDKLKAEKADFVPESGIIFQAEEVVFYEDETVFNVLLREMKKKKIHLEFVNTPMYNSVYIEGISNLYELDCGDLSGWMYKVNGVFPNFGCSEYKLKNGDVVEWVYTCDLGKDAGGEFVRYLEGTNE